MPEKGRQETVVCWTGPEALPTRQSFVYWLLDTRGFGILSVIIILILMGIATGVATSFAHRLTTSRRQSATEEELRALREAILGNPRQYSKQGRSNFGYVGDTGNLPATLEALYTQGGLSDYALGMAGQGAGWAGPYITTPIREYLTDLLEDPFGNTYDYTTTEYTRADGEVVSARIRSFGPNRTDDAGIGDDKQVEILRREVYATNVYGYVIDPSGVPIGGATVTIYYPNWSNVTYRTATTDSNGLFQFPQDLANNFLGIPYGIRTIAATAPATGNLIFAEGSAIASSTGGGGAKDNLSFNITNWGAAAVTVNSIKLDYTIPPPTNNAYFEEVWVGSVPHYSGDPSNNGLVFDYTDDNLNDALNDATNPRGPSGMTITFPDVTIPGDASMSSTTKRILVASDSVRLPDIVLYPNGGGTLNIRYQKFNKKQTGKGSKVSIEDDNGDGQPSFTVTLYYNSSPVLTKSFTAVARE